MVGALGPSSSLRSVNLSYHIRYHARATARPHDSILAPCIALSLFTQLGLHRINVGEMTQQVLRRSGVTVYAQVNEAGGPASASGVRCVRAG